MNFKSSTKLASGETRTETAANGIPTRCSATSTSCVNNDTTISYTLSPGSPVKEFVRLKVTQN